MIFVRVVAHQYHPPVGIVTDTDSMVTMIMHRSTNEWCAVGAIKPGEADAKPAPACFVLPPDIEAELDKRLRAARV